MYRGKTSTVISPTHSNEKNKKERRIIMTILEQRVRNEKYVEVVEKKKKMRGSWYVGTALNAVVILYR